MKKKSTLPYKKLIFIIYFAALLALSYVYAKQRINVCDYISINGDFQSYNVFRRILDGQKPYYDFANYIGMAPVAVNIPFMVADGSFARSLFVTTFTTNVLFGIAVFILCSLITGSSLFSAVVSLLIPKVVTSKLLLRLLGMKYGTIWNSRFEGLFTPSNSMRGARSFLPFLMVIISIAACSVYRKLTEKEIRLIDSLNSRKILAATGFVQGFFIVWSNDFGLACIAAMAVLLAVLQIVRYRERISAFLVNLAVYGVMAVAGLVVSTSVITGFHPDAWFSSVADTGEYQFFYFNGTSGKAVIPYIFSQPVLWLFTFAVVAILLFYLYRLVKNLRTDSDLYAVFILLSVTAATYAYICSGSGYNFREALEVYTVICIAALGAKGFFTLFRKFEKPLNMLMGAALAGLSALYMLQAVTFTPEITGTYIPRLGGTNTQPVVHTEARRYTGDEEVFSMYATGLEVVKGQFQPTGYDYIIHALGQDVQRQYVQTFLEGDYKYVQTPSMETGSWLAQQNWYFYRHLLAGYTMDFQTEYSFIWKKTQPQTVDAQVDVKTERISDTAVKIICTSDVTDTFVADICIEYDTSFDSVLTGLLALGRKAVYASTTCCGYDSPYYGLALPDSGTQYIPVKMEDGRGEAVLQGVYGGGINLSVHSARYMGGLPVFTLEMG